MNKDSLKGLSAIDKFVGLDSKVTSWKQVQELGLMTEEEFRSLKDVPRSVEMKSATQWPKVRDSNGNERTLYPFYSILTEPEKAIYRQYKNSRVKKAAEDNSEVVRKNNEIIDEIILELKKLKVEQPIIDKLLTLKKVKKNDDLVKLFGVNSLSELGGDVNMAYVMFRKDGKFSDELMPKMEDLVMKGYLPVIGLKEIYDTMDKLEKKGIIVSQKIVDLPARK